MEKFIDHTEEKQPVFSDEKAEQLYAMRCIDLGIPNKFAQRKKFIQLCSEKCIDRKLNLQKMMLGPECAALIG